MTDIKFELPALERLAKIIGDAYTGTEITDLFRKADFPTIRHGGGTKWRFLYDEFERMQAKYGPKGILKILKIVCSPQEMLNRANVRKEVNECLAFYGLHVEEDGEMIRVEKAKTPTSRNSSLFDQRNYHAFVVKHARARFLQEEYFGAVGDCCREFEGLVRKKSGIDEFGKDLMAKALNPKEGREGALVMSIYGVSRDTRHSVQEGVMHMCMGMMASVRNPTTHESVESFPIGHNDALEILGVISHLCRQIDRMEPRARG